MTEEAGWKERLEDKLERMPTVPGVYVWKDGKGKILYIGKARNLRNRTRQYFQDSRPVDAKTALLVQEIRDVETLVTDSEYEAFLLESNLVRQHRPRFNIQLKDDKSFPLIRLTVQEPFPRIGVIRRPARDGARYFGPFVPQSRARHLVDAVRKAFGIRHCRREIDGSARQPCCLDYHIHRCLGPCVAALCSPETYRDAVEKAILVLEGRTGELVERLETEMRQAAQELRFEDAATLRDRLSAVRGLSETQKVSLASEDDADVVGFFRQGDRVAVQVFHFRGGRIVDRRQFFWEGLDGFDPAPFLEAFLQQFYFDQPLIPPNVYLPCLPEEPDLLSRWLSERRRGRVRVGWPRRGQRARLVALAEANARHAFFARFPQVTPADVVLERLREALNLPVPPRLLECFDISNTGGTEVVASMVVASEGRMNHSLYRRFRVKELTGDPDDFASMREVVRRRYSRLLRENGELPDAVMVDGGPGQVSAAAESLSELGLMGRVALFGLAKREEEICLPGGAEPLRLARTDPALKFLQQIRDEAHRFAITYHRKRRQGASFASPLDSLPGIGPERKKQLLQTFGSWRKIRNASKEDLTRALGPVLGARIHAHLNPGGDTPS